MKTRIGIVLALMQFMFMNSIVLGQQTKQGMVERIKVHGKSLEGNLGGDSPDRDVSIYLPPSYKAEKNRRYPVIYMLHGFTDSDAQWFGLVKHWINLPDVINKALDDGQTQEMIVVMPNGFTRFKGSMYSSSVTVGDWETFLGKELVEYIDAHYRTLTQPESRGLAGYSMGGYGAMRLGMKSVNVFSSIHGATKMLDQVLGDYGIPHEYESYEGDHLNRIAERLQTKVLPFFSRHLAFQKIHKAASVRP